MLLSCYQKVALSVGEFEQVLILGANTGIPRDLLGISLSLNWNPQIFQDCSNCVGNVHKYCIRSYASWGSGVSFCFMCENACSHHVIQKCETVGWVPLDLMCLHLQRCSSVCGGHRISLWSCCRRHLPVAFSIAGKQWNLCWHLAWHCGSSRSNSFTGVEQTGWMKLVLNRNSPDNLSFKKGEEGTGKKSRLDTEYSLHSSASSLH